MGRRREEKVDEEELARLMGNVEGESSKIRVKMPNLKVNEMFAIAEQILGGRRVTALEFVTSSSASTALNDLTDVTASGAAQGDVLYYNGSAWVLQNGPVIRWSIGNNGASDYTFSGPGFPTATNDPVLYLMRGHTYVLVNTTGSNHPFEIRVSNGGSPYTSGVTGDINGTQTFTVPMDAPSTLYYQCTIHSGMGNTINIVS